MLALVVLLAVNLPPSAKKYWQVQPFFVSKLGTLHIYAKVVNSCFGNGVKRISRNPYLASFREIHFVPFPKQLSTAFEGCPKLKLFLVESTNI